MSTPAVEKSASAVPVGIVGARGYSGLDLARILLNHPDAVLKVCFATESNAFALADYLPEASATGVETRSITSLKEHAAGLHTVFLATPAEVSMDLAPRLLALGVNIIDLSGAFRLPLAQYPEWYGFAHEAAANLTDAQFGLVPFSPFHKGTKPALVSNPGCFATSVLMGLIPLLREKVILADGIVIDSKTGTTGGGKKAAENLLFTEVDGECLPYKVGKHQHFPEIQNYVKDYAGASIDPHFTTSLLPVRRGIISGIYATLAPGKTEADVSSAFAKAYENYPLTDCRSLRGKPGPYALSLKRVVGSARTHLRYLVDGKKLYLHSLIDNLMKGAASQAVENFNRLAGLPVETGLTDLEGTL